jgi:hypothetical protein
MPKMIVTFEAIAARTRVQLTHFKQRRSTIIIKSGIEAKKTRDTLIISPKRFSPVPDMSVEKVVNIHQKRKRMCWGLISNNFFFFQKRSKITIANKEAATILL